MAFHAGSTELLLLPSAATLSTSARSSATVAFQSRARPRSSAGCTTSRRSVATAVDLGEALWGGRLQSSFAGAAQACKLDQILGRELIRR